ncbi:MAG TPA: hypothetical protein PLU10_01515 [Chitinophagaceae bacterium]|nr:hypothetical protein [Chitinophagaceae bacterium]
MKEVTSATPEKLQIPVADQKQSIANHKLAASHHEEASKHHLDAASHYEGGHTEKALVSSVKASGHALHATETHKAEVKQQVPAKK